MLSPDVPSPFLRPLSPAEVDLFTDGFVIVVSSGGLTSFSVGAVARWAGVTPQALLQQSGGRARFIELVARQLSDRWLGWATWSRSGLPVGLPETSAECDGVRAWSAFGELAVSERACGRPTSLRILGEARASEAQATGWALEPLWQRAPAPDELEEFLCLVAGVRSAMAAPSGALAADRGRAIVGRWLATTKPSAA